MRKNFVPKRAFNETAVLIGLSMPQFMFTMAATAVFFIPFVRAGATKMTTIVALIGLIVGYSLYVFFNHQNDVSVGLFGIYFREKTASRPKIFCGRKRFLMRALTTTAKTAKSEVKKK